jgi:hypothetical protein
MIVHISSVDRSDPTKITGKYFTANPIDGIMPETTLTKGKFSICEGKIYLDRSHEHQNEIFEQIENVVINGKKDLEFRGDYKEGD